MLRKIHGSKYVACYISDFCVLAQYHVPVYIQVQLETDYPEYIIPVEPLNANKMAGLERYTKRAPNAPSIVPSFGRNGSSKDFIVYSCVPEDLYIVLALRRLLRASMETACSVEKTNMKLTLECAA